MTGLKIICVLFAEISIENDKKDDENVYNSLRKCKQIWMKIKMITNKRKKLEFYRQLENASISEENKHSLKFAIAFMEGEYEIRLATRSYLFHGEPGVGKTYLVQQFLQVFNVPIIVTGCADILHHKVIKHEKLQDLIKELDKHDTCIIFIDDLSYLLRFNDFSPEEEASEIKQKTMKLADIVKNSNKRILLLITANNFDMLDDSIIDRIEETIQVEIPQEDNKLNYLKGHYNDVMQLSEIRHLAQHSIGYNYRDLAEIVKRAYRKGRGAITNDALREVMKNYVPTALLHLKVIPYVKTNFSNVVGREAIKTALKHVIMTYKKQHLAESLGLKRHNLLIFEGPPGTGKTLMVEALAGEMQFPIIHYKSRHFYEGLSYSLEKLKTLCNRFKNTVIVIDEADKLVGKDAMEEDGYAGGHLNEIFEGLSSSVNSLVIVIVNNINRFGAGLRDRFTMISFRLPSYHERLEFCSRKLATVKDKLSCDINLEEVARLTVNMSFRDIEKLWNQVFFKHLEEENGLRTETFSSIIRSMDKQDNYSGMYG